MKVLKVNQLTFLRFIAAVLVVIWHFGLDIYPFNKYSINFFGKGDLGVSFFFFLSGFVMILAYKEKEKIYFKNYIIKRIARIYPVFLVSILLLLLNKFISNSSYINFKGMFLSLSMLQAWVFGNQLSFNMASWTLSVEFLFYIIFPFLYNRFYAKKKITKKMIFTIVSIWGLTQVIILVLKPSFLFTYTNQMDIYYEYMRLYPLMHVNQFLLGNLIGLFFIKENKKYNYDLLIILNSCLIFVVLNYVTGVNFFHGLSLLLFAPLIYMISKNNGIFTKILSKKPMVFLGEISYGIYILQYPVFYLLEKVYDSFKYNNFTFRFYISIITLIFLSGISYVFLEKTMRKLIINIFLKKY